jgi:hypothetical protein
VIGAPGIGAAARNLFRTVLLVLSGALLAGCLQPFSEADVQMVEDRIPPVIEIAVPINLAEYQAAVTVAGTIHDHAITAGDLRGTVDTVRFEIENTTVTGEWHRDGSGSGLSFDPVSGAFEVTVATADLTARTISLRLTAEDTNLNVSTVTRAMVRTDGPHFSGFELFAPEGSTTFTLLEPLGIRGTLSNSFVDSTGTDNVVSLSWRRGSWSGDIDFSTEPDEAGWYTVENTGTGGTGNRGYFRYHAGTCAVEVYIPRVSGVDASDRLDFQFRAEDRNGNISTHEVSVFGLEAPGGDLVVNPNGQYFSSAAADPRSTEILIEAFSETDRDRITTITFWFDGDLAEAVSIVVDPALWREEVLPGRTDASLVYPLVLTPDLEAEPAGLTKLFGGQYGAGGGSITMDIELIDDNLPGSPLSFSTTLDDDPVAPAISGVTVTAGGSRYAKVGDEVTVSFDIGSETQSGVAVPPALSFFGGAAYAEFVDYVVTPSSGLSGSYAATYLVSAADTPVTSSTGEEVVDFAISVEDHVGNIREYVAAFDTGLDNVRFYKGDPILTVDSIVTSNDDPSWSNAHDTITLEFTLSQDREPASGYPVVRIAGSDSSVEQVVIERNSATYTAIYELSEADPETEIAYEIIFQDAAGQAVTVADTPASGIRIDRTAPAGYSATVNSGQITDANVEATEFTLAESEVGASYEFTFTDEDGTTVTGSGVIAASDQSVSTLDGVNHIDLRGLDDGEITLSVTLTDAASNEGVPAEVTINKDATVPGGFMAGSVKPTGGTVVADFWNGTNTGVDVSIPIADDASLAGGTVQLQGSLDGSTWENLGGAIEIDGVDIGTNKVHTAPDTAVEGLTDFGEGDVVSFRAIITDAAGNATTGTESTDTLTVDRVAPEVSSITSETADGSYNAGSNIDVTVNFDENVTLVGGTLDVTLDTGYVVSIAAFGPEMSGSGTYTVSAGDNSLDLTVPSNSVVLSGVSLRDTAGNDAILTIPAGQNLDDNAALVIDTTAPTVLAAGSVVTTGGTVVSGSWNETNTGVDVSIPIADDASLAGGTVQLQGSLDGSTWENLGEAVAIGAGDINTSKVHAATAEQVEALNGFGEGDTVSFRAIITDAAGNATTGTPSGTTLTVDQVRPAVSSITSGTADGSYREGSIIDVTVDFGESVTLVGGTLNVTLDTGYVVSIAAFGPGTSGSGTYTVSADDNSPDLTVPSDSVVLSGGSLRDAAGNDATLTIPAGQNLADNAALVIDTTGPAAFEAGSVVTTGGTVVADFWNETNSGVAVTIPIDNDESLAGGTVQLQGSRDGSTWENLGATTAIGAGDINTGKVHAATAAQVEGLTDFDEGDEISFRAIITDAAGNATTGTESDDTLTVDRVAPGSFTVGLVETTGGTVEPGYWNGTNSGVTVTIPIADDVSLDGGTVQLQGSRDGSTWENLGATTVIGAGDINTDKVHTATAAQVEALDGFGEGDTVSFQAIITDAAGNATTGTESDDTLTVDRVAPAGFTAGAVTATGGTVVADFWNETNSGVAVMIPIDNDVSLEGGTVQLQGSRDGSMWENLGATTVIGAGDINTDKVHAATAAQVEGLSGLGEGDTVSFRAIITDAAGNATAGTESDDTLTVDQVRPAVSSITSATTDGSYREGSIIDVTVNFGESVTLVGGTLDVTLDTGYVVSIAEFESEMGRSGTYEVGAGDTSADLTVPSDSVVLSGGSLRDTAGNDATLTISAGQNLADNAALVIDTTGPAAFEAGSVVTTGGTVVADFWNETNSGVAVTIPIDNDESLAGGTVQLQGSRDGSTWENLGATTAIGAGDINTGKVHAATAAQVEGLTDFDEGDEISFRAIITDAAGNATTGTESDDTLTVDRVAPAGFTAGAVTATGGTVVAGYWNGTNSGVAVTIPIADDASLAGGTVQLQGLATGGAWENLGEAVAIDAINTDKVHTATAAQVEALDGFGEGDTVSFQAIITDAAGNATTGTESDDTLTVDRVAPAGFTAGAVTATGGTVVADFWNETNSGVAVTIPIDNDESLAGGTVQLQGSRDGSTWENLGTTTVIGAGDINTDKVHAATAAQVENLTGFGEGDTVSFRAIITDAAGNATTGTESDDTLTVDRVAPAGFTAGAVTATGGTVEPGYWNGTNSGVAVTIPIADDASLAGGTVQLQGLATGGAWENLGVTTAIGAGDIHTSKVHAATAAQVEGVTDFDEGDEISFRAIITDAAGNATTGTESDDTLTVDRVAPAGFTAGAVTATGGTVVADFWNETNSGVAVTIPIDNDVSLEGGTVQLQGSRDGSTWGNLGGAIEIDGVDIGTNKVHTAPDTAVEGLTDFGEGDVVSFRAIITDAAGNATTGTESDDTLTVDQVRPAVSSITSATTDGSYREGSIIDVTVNFGESVTLVGGTLDVTLDTGYVVSITEFESEMSRSGAYEVGAGDTSADLTATSDPLVLNGATLRDTAGNDATLTIPAGENLADNAALVIDTTVIGATAVGYSNGGTVNSLSDDTITWNNSIDEEGDTLTYYAVVAKGTTATTVATVRDTYLVEGVLGTDDTANRAVSIASSDDAAGASEFNAIAFSDDLVNYAFVDNVHQTGETAIAIGDDVQVFVVTVDTVGNVAVTEDTVEPLVLTSISDARPIPTGGVIRGGFIRSGAGAVDSGDGWSRARAARSSRAAVQSALSPASVAARRVALAGAERPNVTTTSPLGPDASSGERQDSSAPPPQLPMIRSCTRRLSGRVQYPRRRRFPGLSEKATLNRHTSSRLGARQVRPTSGRGPVSS